MHICIIGGGASGMMAAIAAARHGAEVTILEQKERLGKKLLSTGNGRCNLTNEHMELSCFRGEEPEFASGILQQFGYLATLDFFEELGVMTKSRNGYIYPRCDQATAVLEALELELKRLSVACITNTQVLGVSKSKKGFIIKTLQKIPKELSSSSEGIKKGKRKKKIEYMEQTKSYGADKVILSTGGKAASVLGSDGSGYEFAKAFGHTLAPVVPALVQLRSDAGCFRQLAGIRMEAKIELYVNGQYKASDTGELQFTEYGLSGIPTFQISRFAALGLYEKKDVCAELDLIPYLAEPLFAAHLETRLKKWSDNTVGEFLSGIFPKKMIPVLCEQMQLSAAQKVKSLSKEWCQECAKLCKHFRVPVTAVNSFEQAQVCAGGVRVAEVDEHTLESRKEEGLYLTGELLDIEGICGGYNLQWAWATGFLAGCAAAT